MCECSGIRINVRFWRMDQNNLGTDWILEIIEKEVLKLLSEYKMRDVENYSKISHMEKLGNELD